MPTPKHVTAWAVYLPNGDILLWTIADTANNSRRLFLRIKGRAFGWEEHHYVRGYRCHRVEIKVKK